VLDDLIPHTNSIYGNTSVCYCKWKNKKATGFVKMLQSIRGCFLHCQTESQKCNTPVIVAWTLNLAWNTTWHSIKYGKKAVYISSVENE
jgi:hypothetical protein